jgi:hypothetical protein
MNILGIEFFFKNRKGMMHEEKIKGASCGCLGSYD